MHSSAIFLTQCFAGDMADNLLRDKTYVTASDIPVTVHENSF